MLRARLVIVAIVALTVGIGVPAAAQLKSQSAFPPRSLGFFYADCSFSHQAQDDAIVFPGQPGRSHLHDFFGNRTTDAYSTPEKLRGSTKTTCHRPTDRSAYWVPTLYSSPGGPPIRPVMGSAYYSAEYRDYEAIQPFPQGLEMIAVDSTAREKQNGPSVDWTCTPGKVLDPGRSPDGSASAQALRASIADAQGNLVTSRAAMRRARKSVRRHRAALLRRHGAKPRAQRRSLAKARKKYKAKRLAFLKARELLTRREGLLQAYLFGGGTSIPTCKSDGRLRAACEVPRLLGTGATWIARITSHTWPTRSRLALETRRPSAPGPTRCSCHGCGSGSCTTASEGPTSGSHRVTSTPATRTS